MYGDLTAFGLVESGVSTGPWEVETVIDRWMSSMAETTRLSDRFIELRVALEALYLDVERDELRFRLATYGAWDLGSAPARREAYHKVLKEAYDMGPKAVHTGFVEENASTLRVLAEGRRVCREGILKRLERGKAPDWLQLVLVHEDEGTA